MVMCLTAQYSAVNFWPVFASAHNAHPPASCTPSLHHEVTAFIQSPGSELSKASHTCEEQSCCHHKILKPIHQFLELQSVASEPPNHPEFSPFTAIFPSPTKSTRNTWKTNKKKKEEQARHFTLENISNSSEKRRQKTERENVTKKKGKWEE
jgi:hypothetical protein